MRPGALLAIVLATASLLAAGCVTPTLQGATTDAPDAEGVFSTTDVFPGAYDTKRPRLATKGPYTDILQEVTLVESPLDGADIQVYVMRPDVDGLRVPVIADAGPYFPPMKGRDLSEVTLLTDFVSNGYAFALVSVRGTGDSGGCMDLMGPAERADIDAAITWLGTQPWSNGNVGMFGGSYDGSTQWEAASTGNPHLKTIAPLAGIPDLFSFMVRNGTAMTWTPGQFGAIYWGVYGPVLYNPATGRSADNTAQQVPCPASFEGLVVSPPSSLTGERDALGWWAERDWRDDVLANYEGSIYLIHGLQDATVEPHTAYPFVKQLEAKGLIVKHTVGPWGHELPWRADTLEILLRWYDRWLKDDPSVDIGPKAQALDNLGLWRSERAWPPTDAAPLALHLAPGGKLAREAGAAGEPVVVGTSVPLQQPVEYVGRFNGLWKVYEDPLLTVCPACPRFETETLDEELRFAGSPRLHVTVTPTASTGHLTAILLAVDADGKSQRVGMGMIDLRFAAGDGSSTPVVPGQPLAVRMEMQPTDAAVPEGGKLVLILHQGGYGARAPLLPPAPVRLHVGGANALWLDAFERSSDAYHDAPGRIGQAAPPR